MSRNRRRLVIGGAALLLLLTAACDDGSGSPLFGGEAQPTTAATTSGGDADQDPGEDGTSPLGSDSTLSTGSTSSLDPSRPIPIQEGLGNFDSYVWMMSMKTTGPTAEEVTEIAIELSYSSADDARLVRTTSTVSGPDFETPESTTQEVYTVGNSTCSFDGSEWTSQEVSAQQREALEAARSLFDMTVVPSDPTEVGAEPIAGIPATHYTFVIPGLGQDSGAVVTDNQVDYWVATDSRVPLKYLAIVETRSGPESDPTAEVFRIETSTELQSANQPIAISLPANCPPPEDDGTTDTTLAPDAETTTTVAEAAGDMTTDINVRRFGDLVGTMVETPSCFAINQSAGTTIGATATGIVGAEAYSVSAIVTGISGPGLYSSGELALSTIENDQLIESTGMGDVEVTFPGTDVARLDFDISLNGDAGRARLVGSITCSIAE